MDKGVTASGAEFGGSVLIPIDAFIIIIFLNFNCF